MKSISTFKSAIGGHVHAAIGALALAVLISTTRAASPPEQPMAPAQIDPVTATQVYAALSADPHYFFRHVNVQVRGGVVTLGGYVWDTPSIYRAETIAARLPGVTRVIDEMELERDGLGPHA